MVDNKNIDKCTTVCIILYNICYEKKLIVILSFIKRTRDILHFKRNFLNRYLLVDDNIIYYIV